MADFDYPPWTAPTTLDRDRESSAHAHWWSGAKKRLMRPWKKRSSQHRSASAVFQSKPAGGGRGGGKRKDQDKRRKISSALAVYTPVTEEERMQNRLAKASEGFPLFQSPFGASPFVRSGNPAPPDPTPEPKAKEFDPPSYRPNRPSLKNLFDFREVDGKDVRTAPPKVDVRKPNWTNLSSSAGAGAGEAAVTAGTDSFDSDSDLEGQPLTRTFTGPPFVGAMRVPVREVEDHVDAGRRHSTSSDSSAGSDNPPDCNLDRNPSNVSSNSSRSVDRRQRRVGAVRALPSLHGNDSYQQKLEIAADRRRRDSTPPPRLQAPQHRHVYRKFSLPNRPFDIYKPIVNAPPSIVDEVDEHSSSSSSESYSAEIFSKILTLGSDVTEHSELKGFDGFMMY